MKKDELSEFFKESRTFEEDKASLSEASEKKAWRVATAACVIIVLLVVGYIVLLPLKQTVTEVLVLDRAAGTAEPLQSLKEAQVTLDEVFHKHFLSLFMPARENYSPETAEINYYTAAAFMDPKLQADWGELWKPENPKSPANIYKKQVVRITIASIILRKKDDGTTDVATIRFNRSIEPDRYWVATVTYKLVQAPKEEKDRRINPVGFQIVDYSVDPEIAGAKTNKPATGNAQ